MAANATVIAAQMRADDHLTEDEEQDIQRQETRNDSKAAHLLLCVLRKRCVAGFINSMKSMEMNALDSLAVKIQEHMDICSELKFPNQLYCALHLQKNVLVFIFVLRRAQLLWTLIMLHMRFFELCAHNVYSANHNDTSTLIFWLVITN